MGRTATLVQSPPMRVLVFLLVFLLAAAAEAAPLPATDTSLDRTTPHRTWAGFEGACTADAFPRASKFLDLRSRPHERIELARELCLVMAKQEHVNLNWLSDVPEAETPLLVQVTTINLDGEPIPIELTRMRFSDGGMRWVVSRATVAAVPELYAAFGPRGLEDKMPEVLRAPRFLSVALWQWIGIALGIAAALAIGRLLAWLLLAAVGRVVKRTENTLDDHLVT